MRRHTVFGHFMHFFGADLDFKRNALAADDGRMQRLIAVGLGCGDIILKPPRDRLIEVVDIAEHIVAIGHGINNHTHGADVVNFIDGLVLGIHLAVNRVNMLDARRNGVPDARFVEFFADIVLDVVQELFMPAGLLFQPLDNFLIADWVEAFEGKILQFPFDAAHAQAMGNRRINLHGFERLIPLLALREKLECARIVQAVGQLDENDADILGHGHEHLAQILHLLLLLGVAQHTKAGYAVHQLGDRGSEFVLNGLIVKLGILDAIMQQARADGVGIQPHFNDDLRDRHRMDDVRLSILAFLALVGPVRAFVCRADFFLIDRRVLFFRALNQEIDFVLDWGSHGVPSFG